MGELNVINSVIAKASKAIEESKKLTTKDRKALKKSTFCGPGRSFPVPDCQHVATAKAFLKRSKFSKSTKEKIAACINRKGKQLGCKPGKPAKAGAEEEFPKFIELSYEQKKLYSSEVFDETRKLVEESIKNPGMGLDFSEIQIE